MEFSVHVVSVNDQIGALFQHYSLRSSAFRSGGHYYCFCIPGYWQVLMGSKPLWIPAEVVKQGRLKSDNPVFN